MSKTDLQLKKDIEEELRWDPKVNSAQIGVAVESGAVSLLGTVDSYAEKWAAETAIKRVGGVRTVAQDLAVKIQSEHKHNDSEIAEAVQSALSWNVYVPSRNYQRDAAERAVRYLTGVIAVYNSVALKENQTSVAQVKESVLAALQRQATTDAKSIHIETSGGKVTLTGHASSWQSIENAANAAWAAPGVTQVVDQVTMSMTI